MKAIPSLTLACCAALLAGCGAMDWIKGEKDPNPPKELQNITPTFIPAVRWSSNVGAGSGGKALRLAPAIDDGVIYTADHKGGVVATDLETGSSLWQVKTGLEITAGPGLGERKLLLGTGKAEVIALETDHGAEVWHAKVSNEVLSIPQYERGVVVAATIDNQLFGLQSDSGHHLWVYSKTAPALALHGTSTPLVNSGRVIAGFAGGYLVGLDSRSGAPQWDISITPPGGRTELDRVIDVDTDPLYYDGYLYVASFQGHLAAISPESGVIIWRRKLSAHGALAANWRFLYLADTDGLLWAVDPGNGGAAWKQDALLHRGLTAPVVAGDNIVVGDFEGYLHWISQEDGAIVARLKVDSSPIVTAPTLVDDHLIVYTDSGRLVSVQAEPTDTP